MYRAINAVPGSLLSAPGMCSTTIIQVLHLSTNSLLPFTQYSSTPTKPELSVESSIMLFEYKSMFVLFYWLFCLPTSLGIVNIGVNNVQELIVAADMLQLTEVVNLCCEFLKGQIDPLNCIGIFQFSEQIACHDLLEFTENYIHVHFLEVHSGEEFLALTKDQLIKILRSEELSIEDEYQVFLAAMQWILKDLGKRRKMWWKCWTQFDSLYYLLRDF